MNAVVNSLPPQAQQPIVTLDTNESVTSMYLSFRSSVLNPNQMSDYITRIVQPELQNVPGVQKVQISVRALMRCVCGWIPASWPRSGLTALDVTQALNVNDFISGIGNTKGQMVQVSLNAAHRPAHRGTNSATSRSNRSATQSCG